MRAGFGSFHVLMLFYCGCAWAADATEMMLLSFLGPAVCPVYFGPRRAFRAYCFSILRFNSRTIC